MSHCSLGESWQEISNHARLVNEGKAIKRFYTGGLGQFTQPDMFEVWVCDILDPCSRNSAYLSLPDLMCYTFNEASRTFKPLALNSKLEFVRQV